MKGFVESFEEAMDLQVETPVARKARITNLNGGNDRQEMRHHRKDTNINTRHEMIDRERQKARQAKRLVASLGNVNCRI